MSLKKSKPQRNAAADYFTELCELTKENQVDYAVVYGEFFYKADSWLCRRRVAVKVKKPYGELTYLYTFIVTNMESKQEDVIHFYCNRGTMENFVKELKSGFHMDAMSSHSMITNSNKLQISVLAYNLFNWFRRLVLPSKMRKLQIDTLRLKLIKIATRIIHSARYITFKLCSSCPYQNKYLETLSNIKNLSVKLE